jgi:hypothetical protein
MLNNKVPHESAVILPKTHHYKEKAGVAANPFLYGLLKLCVGMKPKGWIQGSFILRQNSLVLKKQ